MSAVLSGLINHLLNRAGGDADKCEFVLNLDPLLIFARCAQVMFLPIPYGQARTLKFIRHIVSLLDLPDARTRPVHRHARFLSGVADTAQAAQGSKGQVT